MFHYNTSWDVAPSYILKRTNRTKSWGLFEFPLSRAVHQQNVNWLLIVQLSMRNGRYPELVVAASQNNMCRICEGGKKTVRLARFGPLGFGHRPTLTDVVVCIILCSEHTFITVVFLGARELDGV